LAGDEYKFEKTIVGLNNDASQGKIVAVGFIAAMHWVSFYGSIKYANVSVALVVFLP